MTNLNITMESIMVTLISQILIQLLTIIAIRTYCSIFQMAFDDF